MPLMSEGMTIRGVMIATVYAKDGTLKFYYEDHNLIVNVGLAETAALLGGISTVPFKYIAIGTGTTPASATDTALVAEIKRKEATISQITTNVTNDTLQLTVSFSSADGLSGYDLISEAGIFNGTTGGTMLARIVWATAVPMDWDAGDSLSLTWQVQVGTA